MPDGDVIRRGVRYSWRPAYEGLNAASEAADVAGLVAKCLTAALRKHGIPGLQNAASLVSDVRTGQLSLDDGMSQAHVASGTIGGNRDAAILELATKKVLLRGPDGATPEQAVAEAVCREHIDAELFSKLRPAMLESGAFELSEIERQVAIWTDNVENGVRRIAQQLVASPDGSQLRAPVAQRRNRRSIESMLEDTIE